MSEPILSQAERGIKLADRDLIAAAGGIAAVAAHFNVSTGLVGQWNNLNDLKFMSAARRQELEDITRDVPGHPVFTRAQAKRQGYALVKLPSVDIPAGSSLHDLLGDSIRDAGALHGSVVEAWRDQKIEPHEVDRVRRDAIAAAEAHLRLAAILEQMVEA
jgi:hypothetical protein